MPIISQFYGIVISMYAHEQNEKHHKGHIHVRYNADKAVYDFEGNLLAGKMPYKQEKMVEAWIVIHKEELISLWGLLKEGNGFFRIAPLK